MRKRRFSALSTAFLTLAVSDLASSPTAFAQQTSPNAIVGVWEADDGSVKLDMFQRSGESQAHLLYGDQLVESDNVTFKKDEKNPDPTLRWRSMKNVTFITGLHWNDGEWAGGSLHDGSSGHTYRCDVKIRDGKMLLRGYLGISLLGQTREFHRAKS